MLALAQKLPRTLPSTTCGQTHLKSLLILVSAYCLFVVLYGLYLVIGVYTGGFTAKGNLHAGHNHVNLSPISQNIFDILSFTARNALHMGTLGVSIFICLYGVNKSLISEPTTTTHLASKKVCGQLPTLRSTFGWRRIAILSAFFNAMIHQALCVHVFIHDILNKFLNRSHAHPSCHFAIPVICVETLVCFVSLLTLVFFQNQKSKGAVGDSRNARRDSLDLNLGALRLRLVGELLHKLISLCNCALVQVTGLGVDGRASSLSAREALLKSANPVIVLLLLYVLTKRNVPFILEPLKILMKCTPAGVDSAELEAQLLQVDHISDVWNLHVWSVDERNRVGSAYVLIDSMAHWGKAGLEIERIFNKFGVADVSVQPNVEGPLLDLMKRKTS